MLISDIIRGRGRWGFTKRIKSNRKKTPSRAFSIPREAHFPYEIVCSGEFSRQFCNDFPVFVLCERAECFGTDSTL